MDKDLKDIIGNADRLLSNADCYTLTKDEKALDIVRINLGNIENHVVSVAVLHPLAIEI